MIFEKFFSFFLDFFTRRFYNIDMEVKMCVLEDDKECDGCMECEVCDLDPSKACDNCGKCLDFQDFATIKIDKVITDPSKDISNIKE